MQPTCHATHAQIFRTFKASDQLLLARQLGQCYQLETQKSSWATDATGHCPICQSPDSHRHRLLECPGIATLQADHAEAIHAMSARTEAFLVYPLPTRDTEADLREALHFRFQDGTPDPVNFETLQQLCREGHQPCIYTDGSCYHPDDPLAKYSGWATVLDPLTTDEARASYVRENPTRDAPPPFRILQLGRTQGERDSYRAELKAISIVIAWKLKLTIVSDCQGALQTVTKAINAASPQQLRHLDHYDIIKKMARPPCPRFGAHHASKNQGSSSARRDRKSQPKI